MGPLEIAIGAVVGAATLPIAGWVIGISAIGPVAGGMYAAWMSAGTVVPVVQSTLMTVGAASITKTAVVGAIAGGLI